MTRRRMVVWVVLAVGMMLGAPACGLVRQAPPTVTPIFVTATSPPLVIPIVATETPQASPVLADIAASVLPTQPDDRPTATATPPPPITMTPSFTPTATDTPVTPGAVRYGSVGGGVEEAAAGGGCANTPQGAFGAIYQGNPDLPAALGCPLSGVATTVTSAYQPFQNGAMIWVSSLGSQPQSAIYGLYNNATYQRFNDIWSDGEPESSGAQPPAPGLIEPVRGFGKVWRDNPSARDTLGWATAGESGGSAQIQLFERGEMITMPQTGQTYILIAGAPGTWTAR